MKIDTVSTLLEEELKDIYDAEKRLVRALPKMAKAASSSELRAAFEEHLQVTKAQVGRLEQVFGLLDVPVKGKPCAGMKGLIEEGEELMARIPPRNSWTQRSSARHSESSTTKLQRTAPSERSPNTSRIPKRWNSFKKP